MRASAFTSLLLLTAFLSAGCIDPADQVPPTQKTQTGQPRSAQVQQLPKTIIMAHTDAFNKGDVVGMTKMQHPNIEWLNVNGSAVTVEVAGRAALAKNMESYFRSPTRVQSTLSNWNLNGDYISVTETARWKAADGQAKSQDALTVYQIEDNLIRRVWYYPAVQN